MARRHVTPALPKRYAFYCLQEDGDIVWYISPPLGQLEPFDEEFISSMMKAYDTASREGEGSLKHLEIIARITDDEPHNHPDEKGFFPDSLTIKEGMEKLTKGWKIVSSEIAEQKLFQLSKECQLIIKRLNDWWC